MNQQMEPKNELDQKQEPKVTPPPSQSKLPLFLIGGLLLVLIFVGGYKLMSISSPPPQSTQIQPSPTPDLTANWKTYTSEEFSFKYPPSWYQPQLCKFGGRDICIVSPNIQEISIPGGEGGGNVKVDQGGAFGVTHSERTDQMKLEDVCNPGGGLYVQSCQPTTISGQSAMRRVNGNPEDSTTVFILTDKYLYSLTMNYVVTDQEMKSILDQILSTFTFLDQNKESPTDNVNATWKTFNDTNSTFSISYPNDWITTENNSNGIYILGIGKGSSGGFMYGGQSVLVEVAPTDLTNEVYIKNNIAPSSNPLNLGNININSMVGEKWSFNDASDSDNYAIFFVRNGKRYVLIKELGNKSQFSEYNLEIENVLSTFKFLE